VLRRTGNSPPVSQKVHFRPVEDVRAMSAVAPTVTKLLNLGEEEMGQTATLLNVCAARRSGAASPRQHWDVVANDVDP
jgi:hypothetical protein